MNNLSAVAGATGFLPKPTQLHLNYCVPENLMWLEFVGVLVYLPQCICFFQSLFTLYIGDWFTFASTVYSYFIWILAIILQQRIKSPRPYAHCVNQFISANAIPAPEIVYVVSVCLCMIAYVWKEKLPLKWNKTMIAAAIATLYPATHYITYLATIWQIVCSVLFGVTMTAMFLGGFIILYYELHHEKPEILIKSAIGKFL
jgi:hypothetical protein